MTRDDARAAIVAVLGGETRSSVARRMGVSLATISRVVSGDRLPGAFSMKELKELRAFVKRGPVGLRYSGALVLQRLMTAERWRSRLADAAKPESEESR